MKIDQLEPVAAEAITSAFMEYKGEVPDMIMSVYLSASIAISLKRIADQLDGSAPGLNILDTLRYWYDRSANNG